MLAVRKGPLVPAILCSCRWQLPRSLPCRRFARELRGIPHRGAHADKGLIRYLSAKPFSGALLPLACEHLRVSLAAKLGDQLSLTYVAWNATIPSMLCHETLLLYLWINSSI